MEALEKESVERVEVLERVEALERELEEEKERGRRREEQHQFRWEGYIGLIRVKEEGWTGGAEGWQGCSEGFPKSEARGKSRGAALPARGKPGPFRLFYSV